jgi:hypothetical protein
MRKFQFSFEWSWPQQFISISLRASRLLGEELFVSKLVGPYRIFQRKKGHRHGIDDATTA